MLYEITAKGDGTWLHLNGPTKKAGIRLEDIFKHNIGENALREVREGILAQEVALEMSEVIRDMLDELDGGYPVSATSKEKAKAVMLKAGWK